MHCVAAGDGELNLVLQKATEGKTWDAAFLGHEALGPCLQQHGVPSCIAPNPAPPHLPSDAATAEADKKAILLERFQRENPGFDFSGAEVNGAVPDAATFMGGMKPQ